MKLLIRFPDDQANKTIALDTERIRIGRDPRCELTIDAAKFPKVSSVHAELVVKEGHVWLVHRSKSNSTVVGNNPIEKPVRLSVGDRFSLGFTGPEIELTEAPRPKNQTVFAGKASDFIPKEQLESKNFDLGSGGVIGRDESATFQLAHPHISRKHAAINRNEHGSVITDLGSSNGTFVNGTRIKESTQLNSGDVIDIGPFSLTLIDSKLIGRSRANNVRLDVNRINYVVSDFESKRKLNLLNGVTFCVDPGQFVAVLGPSGSGKSTLLKIISGRNWPFTGHVELNGRDLHQQFGALKEDLVVVPQVSAFHESLTVNQTVRYTAALRLPADTSVDERNSIVEISLEKVGLSDRSNVKVNNLSGGQLKRLGLACELVSDPSLLFLDEVTSGLDEQADGEMMQLFRRLANLGKTLICITHNLSHVEDYCHKILVLTEGGRVAFFGTPQQARHYFGVKKLADVYAILITKQPEAWQAAFLNSQYNQDSKTANAEPQVRETGSLSAFVNRVGIKPISQTFVLIQRNISVWLGELPALAALVGQTLLVTVLLCLVFSSIPGGEETENLLTRKTEIRNLLFLIGISCFWLGANNCAKEIVKERKIFERERDFNLVPESYWISKISVLSAIGFLQSALLTCVVAAACGLPGDLTTLIGCSLFLSFIGTNLGLAISAISRSEELAVALVPAVIIPQIILAGVVANLNDVSLLLSKVLMTSFWGQKLFENVIPNVDRVTTDYEPASYECLTMMAIQLFVFLTITWIGVRFLNLAKE